MYSDFVKVYLYSHNPLDFPHFKIDYGILKQIFDKYNLEQIKCFTLPEIDYAFVVISGQGNAWHEEIINKELQKIKKLKLFIIADAHYYFDLDKINHPNIEIWKQYPRQNHKHLNIFSAGTPTPFLETKHQLSDKTNDIFFAGQITHNRRQQLKNILPKIKNSIFKFSLIYTKGYKPQEYYNHLSKAKLCPAPSGEFILDTFRVYESIELLTLPIIDTINAYGKQDNYFELVYKYIPAPRITDWNNLEKEIEHILTKYPYNLFELVSWWAEYKLNLEYKIMNINNICVINLNIDRLNEKTMEEIENVYMWANANFARNSFVLYLNLPFVNEKTIFSILWNCFHVWTNTIPKFNNVI
jgi:hypothetical protein